MKYLIIEWVNDSPVLNGALYYDDMETALKVCQFFEKLVANAGLENSVKYTICKVEKGGSQLEKKADTGILTINVKDFKPEIMDVFKGFELEVSGAWKDVKNESPKCDFGKQPDTIMVKNKEGKIFVCKAYKMHKKIKFVTLENHYEVANVAFWRYLKIEN